MDVHESRGQATSSPSRRRQQDRTAATRNALIEATVQVLHRVGYGGASTALIADEANVSRGAILHHFKTRSALMADVVHEIFQREKRDYAALRNGNDRGTRISDWAELLWQVLSKPSGIAVLEILQAARSDADLATRVKPTQIAIEKTGLIHFQKQFGGDAETNLAAIRLLVWAIRGLTIAQMMVADPGEVRRCIDMFQYILEKAAPSGLVTELCPGPSFSNALGRGA